jgi:uncharacterized lipoprotein YajG
MKTKSILVSASLMALIILLAGGMAQPAYSNVQPTLISPSQNDDETGTECSDADGDGQCDSDTDKD